MLDVCNYGYTLLSQLGNIVNENFLEGVTGAGGGGGGGGG